MGKLFRLFFLSKKGSRKRERGDKEINTLVVLTYITNLEYLRCIKQGDMKGWKKLELLKEIHTFQIEINYFVFILISMQNVTLLTINGGKIRNWGTPNSVAVCYSATNSLMSSYAVCC